MEPRTMLEMEKRKNALRGRQRNKWIKGVVGNMRGEEKIRVEAWQRDCGKIEDGQAYTESRLGRILDADTNYDDDNDAHKIVSMERKGIHGSIVNKRI